jgi:hypothetical protein
MMQQLLFSFFTQELVLELEMETTTVQSFEQKITVLEHQITVLKTDLSNSKCEVSETRELIIQE